MTGRQFANALFSAKKDAAVARGCDPDSVQQVTWATKEKYRKLLKSHVEATPAKQNERRYSVSYQSLCLDVGVYAEQELIDVRSQISLAAALRGLEKKLGHALDPRLTINTDNSSQKVAEPEDTALMHDDSTKLLDEERRSSGITTGLTQERYVHLLATNCADGEEIATAVIARENTAEKRETFLVSLFQFNYCLHS